MYQDVDFTAKVCKQLMRLIELAKVKEFEGEGYWCHMDPVSFDPYMEMPVEEEVSVTYSIGIDKEFLDQEKQIVLQEIASDEALSPLESNSMSAFLVTDFENAVWDISSKCVLAAIDETVEFDKYIVLQDLLSIE